MNVVVHVATPEQHDHLLTVLEARGYKWSSGAALHESLTTVQYRKRYVPGYHTYSDKTCFNVDSYNKTVKFADVAYYMKNRYDIVSYRDYMVHIDETPIENLNKKAIEAIRKHTNELKNSS